MLKIVTAKEMQQIDRTTIEKYGIAGTILMERAGLAVAQKINELFFKKSAAEQRGKEKGRRKTVIVLCGGGNNGGDGLVTARILHNQGKDVEVFLASSPGDLKGDALVNFKAAKKYGVRISPVRKFLSDPIPPCIIVDALLGTGLKKDVRAPLSQVIRKVNELSLPVISVDIPSGISSDTGQIMGCAIKARATVTFGLPKRGHYLHPGAEYTGALYVEDIGFPGKLLVSEKIKVNLPEKQDLCRLLPERPRYSHKGTYGHVLLVAGSKGKTGAALMTAKACLRSGAGLVTIGIPETLVNSFQSRVTEEMLLPLPDKGDGTLACKSAEAILKFLKKRANVLAVGPGLSVDEEISRLVCLLVTESAVPMVIDADGLNALTGKTDILKKIRVPVILTPHAGEMARLLKLKAEKRQTFRKGDLPVAPAAFIEKDRINTALSFSRQTKTYLVLKGVPTVIATPGGEAFINPAGNPGMATAGTGDVLTGMISAFLAQKMNPLDAAVLGVYMHGLTGDIVAQKVGKYSLIASDMIKAIPGVFRSVIDGYEPAYNK
jgi:NAD(P)H-hydrate epimerase